MVKVIKDRLHILFGGPYFFPCGMESVPKAAAERQGRNGARKKVRDLARDYFSAVSLAAFARWLFPLNSRIMA
jgi:hypothetical protein